jgi:two-component system, LytTR family, sensor kinase
VMCILLTILWLLLCRGILGSVIDHDQYPEFLRKSLVIRGSIGFLVMGILTMIAIIWFNWQEQQKSEIRKSDAERLAKEAELFKLRQQLQPHFLFNSLNSINALIGIRPQEARKMVQQLSDFLRGTIRKEETQWVTLSEEMAYLQLYLDIEKVRFGNRLDTHIESDEASLTMKLPALLLQPIVENAIKFGLYDTIGDTVIGIKTYKEDGHLVISVCNPFDPETSAPRQGTGFGLKSVQRRLYLLFARSDLLSTEAKNDIFTITVRIPELPEEYRL